MPNNNSRDLNTQVFECKMVLEQFKIALQQTAHSSILRLPKNSSDIDNIISNVDSNEPLNFTDAQNESFASQIAYICAILSHAINALSIQDFGMFTTLLFRATSIHTQLLVDILTAEKPELINELNFVHMIAKHELVTQHQIELKNLPKVVKSELARGGGNTKRKNDKDGKQAAIEEIKYEWMEWIRNPSLYKGPTDFARQTTRKFKAISIEGIETELAIGTITDKVKIWELELNQVKK